jgi:YfiR/HmsC-like
MALLAPRLLSLAAGFLLFLPSSLASQTVRASASDIQAVFLFNFAQFVEWPAEAFSDAKAPLVIGIMGDDPFGSILDETVRGETVRGRPFKIRRYRRVDDAKHCHILFISRSEAQRLEEILAAVKERPILTVTNSHDFDSQGGVIRFVVEQSRIKLSIDLEAAQATKLTFSSKLLRSASIVPSQRH